MRHHIEHRTILTMILAVVVSILSIVYWVSK